MTRRERNAGDGTRTTTYGTPHTETGNAGPGHAPQMVREEGPSSLMRGVGPNVFRAVLMNASQLASCVSPSPIVVRGLA